MFIHENFHKTLPNRNSDLVTAHFVRKLYRALRLLRYSLPSLGNDMATQEFGDRRFTSEDGLAHNEAFVRRVQKARKLRDLFVGENLFADPAWDMLLELYANELAQQRVSVSSASDAAGVPLSTALRWMAALEERGLVARTSDPLDGRRVWISLTAHGASLMHRYFTTTAMTSLAP